jgi:hypothetical protein
MKSTFTLFAVLTAALAMLMLGPDGTLSSAKAQSVVRCESIDGGRNYCAIGGRGEVWISQQLSNSPCYRGRSWGVDPNRRMVWVDRGCRADFVTRGGWGGDRSDSVVCESIDGGRNECRLYSGGDVYISQQYSHSACWRGRTWGYNYRRGTVWVDDGCRAEFRGR